MTETAEPTSEPESAPGKPTRLRRALTWAGIAAAGAIVAAAVFISGAATGWLPGWHGHFRTEACMMSKDDAPKGPMPGDKGCCPKKAPGDRDCCELTRLR
ncbi:hypothetical protein MFM001_38400 [Mycobacterium sp. MFM001]|nr:hypothetical protein MFM001_38400 [Mycobacterium sp. MFM001]